MSEQIETSDAERIWRAMGAPGSIGLLAGQRPWALIETAFREAIAAEREGCARELDGMADEEHQLAGAVFANREVESRMMLVITMLRRGAAAIRARGEG